MLWIYIGLYVIEMCASQNFSDVCINSTCPAVGSSCKADTVGGYRCQCLAGFRPPTCSDLDECSRGNPCKNRGNCINTPGSYTCTCLSGWTGYHCKDNTTEPRACIFGWLGDDCDIDLDECTASGVTVSCINNSTCKNTPGSYTCDCLEGFQGYTCGDDVNECLSSPCEHSGNCINAIGSYKCACVASWTGYHCEVQIASQTEGDTTNISVILGPSLGCLLLIGGIVGGVFFAKYIRKKRMIGDSEEGCTTIIEVDQETATTNGTATVNDQIKKVTDGDTGTKDLEGKGDVSNTAEDDGTPKKIVMKTRFSMKKVFNK